MYMGMLNAEICSAGVKICKRFLQSPDGNKQLSCVHNPFIMIIRRSFPALVLMLLSTVWGFHSPNKATGYFGIHAPANTIFFSKNVNMIGEGSERSTNFGEGLVEFTMSAAESASAFDPRGVALFSLPVIKGTPKAVVKPKFVSGRIPAKKAGGAKFKPIPGDNAVQA